MLLLDHHPPERLPGWLLEFALNQVEGALIQPARLAGIGRIARLARGLVGQVENHGLCGSAADGLFPRPLTANPVAKLVPRDRPQPAAKSIALLLAAEFIHPQGYPQKDFLG